jgi:hypothetical protein
MKRHLITGCFIIISTWSVYAQEEENYKGEFYLAPDFGLMLGTINQIEVSPAIGYHLSDRFSIGCGFKYEFYSQTRVYTNQTQVKTQIYGPRAFVRYTVFRNLGSFLPIGMNTSLFLHSEFEALNLEKKFFYYPNFPDDGRFWYNTILIGGGFSQAASERLRVNILVLWNTDAGNISLYNNPVIRFGFQFYLRPLVK